MGMPNIPEIKDKIKLSRKQVINLLLASIAMEELGLAHIINAKGEELQCILEKCGCEENKPGRGGNSKCNCSIDDLLKVNESINSTLKTVVKKEMLLQFKLEDVMKLCNLCEEEEEEEEHC